MILPDLNSQAVQDIFFTLAIVIGGMVVARSRVPQQTIINQRELIDTYEKRLEALEERQKEDKKLHEENSKEIARLQGQIEVYKELPLRELAAGMDKVRAATEKNHALFSKIADTNIQIVDQLRATAAIAAEDRDVLTNQNLHIKTEVKKELAKT